MAVSLYDACVPPFTQMLQCQLGILHKAQAHAASRRLNPASLVNARLSRDMPTFGGQVDLLSGIAVRAPVMLTRIPAPSLISRLDSLEALKKRLIQVLSFLKQLHPEQFLDSENKIYDVPFAKSTIRLSGSQYLFHIAMPSFHFHASMVVGILRLAGVELSRVDYLQPPD